MKLTQLFTGEKQIEDAARAKKEAGSAGTGSKASLGRQIRALVPGQTLRGEVISRNGSEVSVRLAEDMVINARVERSLNLETGKNMTFEVKNNGSTLVLSPLFENMAADANVLKAIEMAGLPVNDTTVSMTELLMRAGLSIDKNTLQQVYREAGSFPDASVEDIVDLHKLGLPVNENNLAQIASHKNFTYQLETGLYSLMQELPGMLAEMAAKGDVQGAVRLLREIFSLLQETAMPAGEASLTAEQLPSGLNGTVQILAQESPSGQAVLEAVFGQQGKGQPTVQPGMEQVQASQGQTVQTEQTEQGQILIQQRPEEQAAAQHGPGGQSEIEQGAAQTEQAPVQQSLTEQPAGNRPSMGAVLEPSLESLLKQLWAEKGLGKESVIREIRAALSQNLQEGFTLTLEEASDLGQVERFYQRLGRQLKALTQVLEEGGQTASGAFKAVSNLSGNLDFLQQVNQLFTYIQLPLRLQQGGAHGDLYVFTNKKNLAASKGSLSALLHLDMEHLGPVDVYVTMQSERVSTRFYVKDEEMLDFLEQHMELLTKRLQKKGYDCSFSMQVREEKEKKTGGMEPFLGQESHVPMAHYAFDMRA